MRGCSGQQALADSARKCHRDWVLGVLICSGDEILRIGDAPWIQSGVVFRLDVPTGVETEVATKTTHTARRVGALNLRQTLLHGPDHLVAAGPRCGLLAFDVVAEQ